MLSRKLLGAAVLAFATLFVSANAARAEDWGRYYHWPYHSFHQYQWTPYEYQPTYNGGFRYPEEMRVYPTPHGQRNWLNVRKPYYRGHHFILDRF
jgi:hypothetical protein